MGKVLKSLLVFSVALLLLGSFTSPGRALSVLTTINDSVPIGIAYDSSNGNIYAPSNSPSPAIQVISGQTNTVVDSIPIGASLPIYDQGKNEIFVFDSSGLQAISAVTNQVVATIGTREPPLVMVYDSGKDEVFVFVENSTALVVSDSSNTIVKSINLTSVPGANAVEGVAYDPAKGEIFFTTYNDNHQVGIISDQSNSVVGTVNVGGRSWGAAYDPARSEVFVSVVGNITAISDASNTVVGTQQVGTGILTSLAYDSVRGEILAADNGGGKLEAMSDSNSSLQKSVMTGPSPYYLAYDTGNGASYVADSVSGLISVVVDASLTITPDTGPAGTTVTLTGSYYSAGRTYNYCFEPGFLTSPTRCPSGSQFTATGGGQIPDSTKLSVSGGSGLVVVSDPADPAFIAFQAFHSSSGNSTTTSTSTVTSSTSSHSQSKTSSTATTSLTTSTSGQVTSVTSSSSSTPNTGSSSPPVLTIELALAGAVGVAAIIILWKLFVAKGAGQGAVRA